VWFYLYKTLIPLKLAMIYPRWQINTASALTYLPLLVLIGGFYALWFYRKRIGRSPLFALGYFVITLGPVLGFVPIYFNRYSLVADHWQYLAMPGLAALLAAAGAQLLQGHPQARLPVAGGVIILLSALSFNHARSFADPYALWSDNVRKYPLCAAAQADLGLLLTGRKEYDQAIEHLSQAVDLEPDIARHWVKLGIALLSSQRNDQAVRSLRRAVKNDDADAEARRYLAGALMRTNQYVSAAKQYAVATKLKPADSVLHLRYADALAKAGDVDEAIDQLEKLMQRKQFWPDAMDMLARILARHRDPSKAIRLAERACNLNGYKRPRFIHTLAIAYAASGDIDAARKLAMMALQKAHAQDHTHTAQQIENFLSDLPADQSSDN
jgi:tetratricopeptide (TPR) repeat protein